MAGHSPDQTPPSINGFGVGFFAGILGGMSVYYLFGQQKGQEILHGLTSESRSTYQDLQAELPSLQKKLQKKLRHRSQSSPALENVQPGALLHPPQAAPPFLVRLKNLLSLGKSHSQPKPKPTKKPAATKRYFTRSHSS